MYKLAVGIVFGVLLFNSTAMAQCSSYPYTLTNGTTANASQVMANFNCAALTSGSNLTGSTLSGVTLTGTTTIPGSGTIGSTGDVGIGLNAKAGGQAFNQSLNVYGNMYFTNSNTNAAQKSWNILGAPYYSVSPGGDEDISYLNGTTGGSGYPSLSLGGGIAGTTAVNSIYFFTGSSYNTDTGSVRMTINGSGNVGIGTTSPSYPLNVVGAAGIIGLIVATDNNAYSPSTYVGVDTFWLSNSSTTAGTGSGIGFSVKGAGYGSIATIAGISTAADYSSALIFMTRSSGGTDGEKMRITASGNVGIGTTSPSYTLHVNGSVAGTSAYNNLSDIRLKKDVVPIRNGLDIVAQLQGVHFQWRTPSERTVGKSLNLPVNDPQIGFIAQNLKKVLPEAVSLSTGSDGIMSVAESKVVPVLVEAIKELKAADDNQAAEIRELRQQIAANDNQAADIQLLKKQVRMLSHGTGTQITLK